MASILDQTPDPGAMDEQQSAEAIGAALKMIMEDDSVPQVAKDALTRMGGGETIAQIQGLTRDDLEALYALGYQRLIAGELDKARDVFSQLAMIDPLEAKNHYCLGVTYQHMGHIPQAAKAFVNFLAMDATNPDGYLRLGECHLAAGETEEAREAFELAEAEAAKIDATAQRELARAQLARIAG